MSNLMTVQDGNGTLKYVDNVRGDGTSGNPFVRRDGSNDGDHVAIGATTDAAVYGDNSGSLVAFLRGMSAMHVPGGNGAITLRVGSTLDKWNNTTISLNTGNTDAGTLRVVLGNNQPTLAMSLSPSNGGMGAAVPNSQAITVGLTNNATYTSGKLVAGNITLSTVNYASGRRLRLDQVTVIDRRNQRANLHLYFFSSALSGGTYGDNATLAWGTGDAGNTTFCQVISNADYTGDASQAIVSYADINAKLAMSDTTLRMLLVAQGSYTWQTGDLTIRLELGEE